MSVPQGNRNLSIECRLEPEQPTSSQPLGRATEASGSTAHNQPAQQSTPSLSDLQGPPPAAAAREENITEINRPAVSSQPWLPFSPPGLLTAPVPQQTLSSAPATGFDVFDYLTGTPPRSTQGSNLPEPVVATAGPTVRPGGSQTPVVSGVNGGCLLYTSPSPRD